MKHRFPILSAILMAALLTACQGKSDKPVFNGIADIGRSLSPGRWSMTPQRTFTPSPPPA